MNAGPGHTGHENGRGVGVAVIFSGVRFPIKSQATIPLFGLARDKNRSKTEKNKPTG